MASLRSLAAALALAPLQAAAAQTPPVHDTIAIGAVVRDYYIYGAPGTDTARTAPLLIVFHGGDGNGRGAAARYGFSEIAGGAGAIVVYPDGMAAHWADGRGVYHAADDGAFIAALVHKLTLQLKVDPRRIYAAGHSNGAIFANTLACRLPGVFAAIGTVAGSLPTNDVASCGGAHPISVIAIHGTADPLAPYAGGTVGPGHGSIIGAERSAARWAEIDRCASTPVLTPLEPHVSGDSTRVVKIEFPGCAERRAVILYEITGAGHDWPGGIAVLPASVVGPPTRQLDATRLIWDFLLAHPAP
jgi:polyhydroxybutyrate depolymerase